MELTNGMGADVAVDCVGGKAAAKILPQALELVHKKGKIGMVGMFSGIALEMTFF